MSSQQNNQQNNQRRSGPSRSPRLGQTTVGERRDIRVDYKNEKYEIKEVFFILSDGPTEPIVNKPVLYFTREGLEALSQLLDDVLDEQDKPDAQRRQIDSSKYMVRIEGRHE